MEKVFGPGHGPSGSCQRPCVSCSWDKLPDQTSVCVGGNWTGERKLTHSSESEPLSEGHPRLLARQEHQLKKQNTPLHHYPPFCLFYKGIFQWPTTDYLIKWYLFFSFSWNLARYSALFYSPLTLPLPFFHTHTVYAPCSSLSPWQPHPDEETWRCWATACSTGSVELSPGCQCSGIQHRSRRPKPSTHASLFLLLTQVQKQHSAVYVVAADHRLTAAVVFIVQCCQNCFIKLLKV